LRNFTFTLLIAAFAAIAEASDVDRIEVALVRAQRGGSVSTRPTPCDDCRWVRVEDALGRASEAFVKAKGDLSLPARSIRALLAFEDADADRSQRAYRVVAILDSAARRGPIELLASGITQVLVRDRDGRRHLGAISPWSSWELEIGWFDAIDSLPHQFFGAPVFGPFPGGAAGATTPCDPAPGDAATTDRVVWMQGSMRSGRRHGAWISADRDGDVVLVQIFRDGCLVGSVNPGWPSDTQAVKDFMRRRGADGGDIGDD
jgi:hypothetical protein